MRNRTLLLLGVTSCVVLPGCSMLPSFETPIQNSQKSNICSILKAEPEWRTAGMKSWKKWGTPIWTQLAIVKQESSFKAHARPPLKYFLNTIPTGRASTAYGYSQALDGTWRHYKRATGKRFVSRSDISDSLDFIGWYNHQASKRTGISLRDARNVYLAYHEGPGGFNKKTYRKKRWLMNVANKVQRNAVMYKRQFKQCR
jgi:hypothetical protein